MNQQCAARMPPHLRTHFNIDAALTRQYSSPALDEVRALAQSTDPHALARLVPLATLLDYELAFLSLGTDAVPYVHYALDSKPELQKVLLNFGAMSCLNRCLERLAPGGFILLNDYGPVSDDQAPAHSTAQRFGVTTAVGLNFPLIEDYFGGLGVRVRTPTGDDERALHSRLITKSESPRTAAAFQNRFSAEAYYHFEHPVKEARARAVAGRKSEALDSYRAALSRSPRDWTVIGEAAEFVSLHLRDHAAAVELCRAALDLNPIYSAWLWNVLGDALFCLERTTCPRGLPAGRAHRSSRRTDEPESGVHVLAGRQVRRLFASYRARACGRCRGVFRDRLLEKQQQVIGAITSRWLGECDRLAKRNLRFQSSQ
jgi:hypothetical protein